MTTLAYTGHRPNKLWGYDYNHPKYIKVKEQVKADAIATLQNDTEKKVTMVSGMALGFDTIVALAAIELKQEGYDVRLVAAIPCSGQEKQWPDVSKATYRNILTWCDEIVGMTETGYVNLGIEYETDFFTQEVKNYLLYKKDVQPNESHIYSQPYKPWLMQKRNEYMVDRCDKITALWDGSSGGTGNCVKYAIKQNKNILTIVPERI